MSSTMQADKSWFWDGGGGVLERGEKTFRRINRLGIPALFISYKSKKHPASQSPSYSYILHFTSRLIFNLHNQALSSSIQIKLPI